MKSMKKIEKEKMIFIFSILFTIIASYYITWNCIDSDASSELILANHLASVGGILSTDWIYSTELRVLNTQLVYTPLFFIFNDWHLVRYLGSLILQFIMILSFYFFTKQMKINKKVFYISSALMLLPINVCYGRIVLYNTYYIPHIALNLIMLGLIFGKSDSYKKVKFVILCLLSFVGGLGGIRQLMMTHAPSVLATFYYCFYDDFCNDKNVFIKSRITMIINVISSFLFSFIGFVVNKFILTKIYTFSDMSYNEISLLSAEKLNDVLYGFLHHFGFRDNLPLISILGILSTLSVIFAFCLIVISVYKIVMYKNDEKKNLVYVYFISYIIVMLMVFLLIGQNYYFVLYFTPLSIWIILLTVLNLYELNTNISIFNIKRFLSICFVLLLLGNGFANSYYLIMNNHFLQKYEGLSYKERDERENRKDVIEFLLAEKYTLGYASFWNSNIMSEITNGQIKTINILINEEGIQYYNWLTLKSNRTLQEGKKFLLLTKEEAKLINLDDYKVIYKDERYVVFDIKYDFLN